MYILFIEEAMNDSGEKGYKLSEQILFNFLALCFQHYMYCVETKKDIPN